MPLRTDSYYRQLVNDHLKQADIGEPPISLDDVAARIGVPVIRVSFPAWFTGAIVMDEGMPVIMLNEASSPEGRRAALGHLLSHILVRIDDPSTPYPRNDQPDHRLADLMSEEFIMPAYLVHEQARKWFNDYRYLARLFGVSETDMLEKMRDMGLIKSRGMIWDY
ncbi:MAG: ImmA/IrrE family metallo-endopeptidase [Coriobacteriia bacterium]|nr:ImmA/IrrE family metallo-endopeptidase [Coriobacteriia bacterium]